ncbi:MAG: tripartite tricarboxylate transporter substrate binding protein [Burkholderiales bacterium]|nr:tripartite tricarboxylate transporter substrate binding protein [Burkholderiales bacterium]
MTRFIRSRRNREQTTFSPRTIINGVEIAGRRGLFPSLRRIALYASLAVLAAPASSRAVQAASGHDPAPQYPARPIRLIVPFPPGGSNDIVARYLGHYLTERWNRQVVIDNRAGAEGVIGTEVAARAVPDGHTLLLVSAAFTANPAVRKLPYDSIKDFVWAGMLGYGPSLLSVHPGLPVNSVKELQAYGKTNPNKLTMATSGGYAGFASYSFRHHSGIDMLVVVYKGGFPAMMDVIAGQAQVNLGSLIQAIPQAKAGKLKALATSGGKRASAMPELPTIAEAGVAGYEANNWWAVAAPAGTPAAVLAKLSAEIERFVKLPETQKRFTAEGAEAEFRSPAEIVKLLPVELAKWANVAKVANIPRQ